MIYREVSKYNTFKEMQLTHIIVYPIKSLGAVILDRALVKEQGLEYDRRWMLVDEKGKFMTIRNTPEFIHFKVALHPKGFLVQYKSEEVVVPFKPQESSASVMSKVWGDSFNGLVATEEIDQWFSQMLGQKCRLVYIPQDGNRFIKPDWGISRVSLADGYPYLITGKASLEDLNSKLSEPITIHRFRPNLVFDGGEPYEEYRWSQFTIGKVNFQGLKPCERCVVTTYDLESGEKGREPLLTLSKQKINNKVVFGQHSIVKTNGEIVVGDKIKVLSRKHSPYDAI